MVYTQPLSAQTASNYPAAHQEANTPSPAAPKETESSSQPENTDSSFSVGDAVWVVMRTISTAAECLNFVCRKVVVLTSVCIGGFIGLLQYAHENLGSRTVQKLPAEDNNRIDQQPPSQPSDKVQPLPSLSPPPVEEYVSKGANRWKSFVESSTTPGSTYSWMQLLGTALSIISSILVLGVVGSAILHIPALLLKPVPYIKLDESIPPTELSTQTASTLPLNQQEPKAPAPDPVVDGQPLDNAASQPPPPQIEQQPAFVTSGESSQGLLDIQSTPSVEANNINPGSHQPTIAADQYQTPPPQEPLTSSAHTTQQPITSVSSPQPTLKAPADTLPTNITTPTGHQVPTSVTVDTHCLS